MIGLGLRLAVSGGREALTRLLVLAVAVGLGVGDDNPRAADLYLHLGYAETGCRYLDRYEITDGSGARQTMADPCRFLVKNLPPERLGRPGTARP